MTGKWCGRCGQIARLGEDDWMCAACMYSGLGLFEWQTKYWTKQQWADHRKVVQDQQHAHAEAMQHYLGDGNWTPDTTCSSR